MSRKFIISEDERARILGLHETAKSNHGTVISEQSIGIGFKSGEPNGLKIKKIEATEQVGKKPVSKSTTQPGITALLKAFSERGVNAIMDPTVPNRAWVGIIDNDPDGNPFLIQPTSYTVYPGDQFSHNLPYILSITYDNQKNGYRTNEWYPVPGYEQGLEKSEKNIFDKINYSLSGLVKNREIFQKLMDYGINNTKDKRQMQAVAQNGNVGKIKLPDYYLQSLKQGGIA